MIGYDIDGVLASKPTPSDKKWGRMNGIERREYKLALLDQYANATPLLVPTEPFIAISARKEDPAVRRVTTEWLMSRYGVLAEEVVLLPRSRSIENVIDFKSAAILNYQITEFTEDNKKILKGLALNNLPCDLYFWEKGMESRVAYNLI